LEGLLKACEKEEDVFVYKSLEKLSRKAGQFFFIKTWLFMFFYLTLQPFKLIEGVLLKIK